MSSGTSSRQEKSTDVSENSRRGGRERNVKSRVRLVPFYHPGIKFFRVEKGAFSELIKNKARVGVNIAIAVDIICVYGSMSQNRQ